MFVKTVDHLSGDQIPMLLDKDGLPIPMPSEFVLSRRALATNTLIRNLRELSILQKWLENERINLSERISSGKAFTEADIRGGLVESLRRDQSQQLKVKKMAVTLNSFNQRLTTIRQYLCMQFDIYLGSMAIDDMRYERIRDQKMRILSWLDSSFISAPPTNFNKKLGLTLEQTKFLVNCLDPNNEEAFGRNPSVRFRNYVSVMIMLNYGLRPGELLSLKVEDIEFGAISAILVTRRSSDLKDKRRPRPQIKRNGRVMPIDNPAFARHLEENSSVESEYLILSDEGVPLSQQSITQFFQLLRKRFPDNLAANLTAKSLRHTFSSNMEKELRAIGMDEDRRKEALADLRGDSNSESQNVYLIQEIQEQANRALQHYHRKILG